jgi:organic hydroperoxide reductase OsmC/OhrA
MSVLKDFRFCVGASPLPRRRVRLESAGKPALELAAPPEFRGGTPGMWSPEEFLVASAASCFVLTFDSVALHRDLRGYRIGVEGVGHVARRAEGRLGFVVIELLVDLAVQPGDEEKAERAARAAEQSCIVGHALEVPIELELRIRVDQPQLTAVS